MSFVYFADRDLGRQFPKALADAGLAIEQHDDLFPPTCTDEEWLEYVGTNRRIAITHNRRIRYIPNERDAVIRHKVSLLVLVGQAPLSSLAQNFLNTLPRIERFLEAQEPPFIAKVYRPTSKELRHRIGALGRVELWYSASSPG